MADVQTETKTFLQKHERLIIVIVLLAVSLFLGNKYLDINIAKKDAAYAVLQQTVKTDEQKLSDQATQSQQDRQNYLIQLQQLSSRDSQLIATIQSDNQLLAQKQAQVMTLPLPQLADEWKQLAGIQDVDITASQTGINVTDAGARATVNQLEEVPVLKDELSKQLEVSTDNQTLLQSCNKLNTDLTNQVNQCSIAISDNKKADAAQISDLKANQHKSNKKWFIRGLEIGGAVASYLFLR